MLSAALGTCRVISSGHWWVSAPGRESGKRKKKKKRFLEVYCSLSSNTHILFLGRLCFPGCSPCGCCGCSLPHTPSLALGSAAHSFPVFGSGAFSILRETWLGAMLCEAIGCSRQGDIWLGLSESLQRVWMGRKVLVLWAFPAGPKARSLGSGWEVEGSCSLPAQHSELCSAVGTWEIVTRHWPLQRSFRTRGFAPRTLESAWALLSSAA